jgi:hypothetical protein
MDEGGIRFLADLNRNRVGWIQCGFVLNLIIPCSSLQGYLICALPWRERVG